MKKFIPFLLILIFAISLFMSCANEENESGKNDTPNPQDTENNTDNTASTEEEYIPDLPDANYNGYEFRILNSTQDALHWMTVQLLAEEETGDSLNDEIYHRNVMIEDKYGVKLVENAVGGTASGAGIGTVRDQARKSILAGSDEYDLVMISANVSLDLMKSEMFVDFNNIPHIDFSKPWWDQNLIQDITIANKLYIAPGDFSLTHYSTTLALCFNKKLVRDYALEDPYQLVKNNKWTVNKFFEMMKSCSADLNGDGLMDENDLYGLSALHFVVIPSLSTGAGMEFVAKDSNDIPTFVMNSASFIEKIPVIIDGLYAGQIMFDADARSMEHKTIIDLFADDRALFFVELLHHSHYFREMDVDMGFLPHPKYDESQENYITNVFNTTLMAVPATSADLERTGIILEALSAESRKRVIPAYYDKMLKTKIARDDESGEMLDIMFSTRKADLGVIYWESQLTTPFSAHIGKSNNHNVASFLERNQAKIERDISTAVEAFMDMD